MRSLKRIATDIVEDTGPRPGKLFLFVNAELVEELAAKIGATLGEKERQVTDKLEDQKQ